MPSASSPDTGARVHTTRAPLTPALGRIATLAAPQGASFALIESAGTR